MFDYFNIPHPELNKTIQQFQGYAKQAYDFWIDSMIDAVKLYKTK